MSGGEEPLGFLRYAGRPPGQDHEVKTAAAAWHEAAQGIREVTERLDREVARIIGPRWHAADARRMLDAWDALRRDADLVEDLLRDTGAELDKLSTSIRDAQQDWDRTMAALALTVGISIGLGVVSFGLSNLAAGSAARAAAAATVGIAGWLEGIVQGSGVVLLALAEASGAISARLAVGFGVNLASQSIAGAVTSPDHGFGHVDTDQAFLFAGLDAYLGPAARAALPGRAPGWVAEGAAASTSDALAQVTRPEHTIDPLRVLLSGGLGAGAGKVVDAAVAGRIRALRPDAPPPDLPPPSQQPLPRGVFRVSKEQLDPVLVQRIARRLGVDAATLEPRLLESATRGWSGADVWFVAASGEPRAVAKVFTAAKQGAREHQAIQRLHRETFPHLRVVDELVFGRGRTDAGTKASIVVMSVAPGRSNHAILEAAGSAGGRMRAEALDAAERAVASGARALVDLHTVPSGSGGPVPHTYIEESVDYLMQTARRLESMKPVVGRHLPVDVILEKLPALIDAYRADPGGASLVHGDAHPGNFHFDPAAGTTLIDTPNLPFSIDPGGTPVGSPARDYTAYVMRLRSFGLRSGLHPPEIERLQEVAERAYQSAGGPALTPEAVSFFRARVALADLAWEARPLADAGEAFDPAHHPGLAAALDQARSVFGL